MKKLYFVFDQIPSAQSGGLIGMYLNICEILKYDYDIEIADSMLYALAPLPYASGLLPVLFQNEIDVQFFFATGRSSSQNDF